MGAHLVGDHFFGTPCRRVLANPGFGSGILKLELTNSGKWIMPGSFLTVIDLQLKRFLLKNTLLVEAFRIKQFTLKNLVLIKEKVKIGLES